MGRRRKGKDGDRKAENMSERRRKAGREEGREGRRREGGREGGRELEEGREGRKVGCNSERVIVVTNYAPVRQSLL